MRSILSQIKKEKRGTKVDGNVFESCNYQMFSLICKNILKEKLNNDSIRKLFWEREKTMREREREREREAGRQTDKD